MVALKILTGIALVQVNLWLLLTLAQSAVGIRLLIGLLAGG